MLRQAAKYGVPVIVVLIVAIQFVQPERTNPRSHPEAHFDVAAKPPSEVAAIFKRACADCHSNQTVWPPYSRVAPVSWLVARDVRRGRARMNFSEWNFLSPQASHLKLKSACKETRDGRMPLWQYRLMHAEARLTSADVEKICSAAALP
jgi:hypothetical protein